MMACAIGQVLCGQEVAPVLACAPRAGQRDRALRLLGASRPGPLPHGLEGGGGHSKPKIEVPVSS